MATLTSDARRPITQRHAALLGRLFGGDAAGDFQALFAQFQEGAHIIRQRAAGRFGQIDDPVVHNRPQLGAAGAWFVGYEFHGYSCVFVLGWFLDEIHLVNIGR
jgi:hypothetical protein